LSIFPNFARRNHGIQDPEIPRFSNYASPSVQLRQKDKRQKGERQKDEKAKRRKGKKTKSEKYKEKKDSNKRKTEPGQNVLR